VALSLGSVSMSVFGFGRLIGKNGPFFKRSVFRSGSQVLGLETGGGVLVFRLDYAPSLF